MSSSEKSVDYANVHGREIKSWRELKEELNKPNPMIFDGPRPVDKAKHALARKLRKEHNLSRIDSEYIAHLEIKGIQAEVDKKYPLCPGDPIHLEIPVGRERALYTKLYNLLSGKREIANIDKRWDLY